MTTPTEHSTCQSNDSEGSFGNPSEHSSKSESESISVSNEMSASKKGILRGCEESTKLMGFTLDSLTEQTQTSQSRIATLAIRVRSFSDLTAQDDSPMIRRSYGYD
ncbi:hypothetical protein Tco_0505880 [Tanacetum coccineum]